MTATFKGLALSTTLISIVAISQVLPGFAASSPSSKSDSKEAAKSNAKAPGDEASVKAGVIALIEAVAAATSQADAAKMAALWTADAQYTDEEGARTSGRKALEERFASAWANGVKGKVVAAPSMVRMLGSDSAWAEGTVSRQTPLGLVPTTRFTMLLQRQNGTWLIASASETAINNKSAADRLSPLAWMIGDWQSAQGPVKVTMNADWANNKSFIICKFKTEKPESQEKADCQIIGWDPTKDQIVSWHFDSEGGFGYGSWSKRGKQWVISAEGVEQSGSRSNATNILSIEDTNKFTWQSVARNLDGVPVSDSQLIQVQRAGK